MYDMKMYGYSQMFIWVYCCRVMIRLQFPLEKYSHASFFFWGGGGEGGGFQHYKSIKRNEAAFFGK